MKLMINHLPKLLFVAIFLAVAAVVVDQNRIRFVAASFEEEAVVAELAIADSHDQTELQPASPHAPETIQLNTTLVGSVDLKWGAVGTLNDTWTEAQLSELSEDASFDIGFLLDAGPDDVVVAYIDLESTLVFTKERSIQASLNSADVEAIDVGPMGNGRYAGNQLTIESERIKYTTESGQEVERQFSLSAEPGQDPDVLLGEYRETVWGMARDPLTIIGSFELRELAPPPILLTNGPQTEADAAAVEVGQSIVIDVLANDAALEGTLDPTTVEIIQPPEKGSVSVDPTTGAVTYASASTGSGEYTFTYIVQDSRGVFSSIETVTITVSEDPIVPPQALADAETVKAGQSIVINVLANDTATDGTLDPTTVKIIQPPGKGTAVVNRTTGAVTYTAAASSSGTDTFTYSVQDSRGAVSASGMVTITIQEGGTIYLPLLRLDN